MVHWLMASVTNVIKFNPAVVAGLISAAGIAGAEGDITNWASLGAILVSVVVRQFVTPTIRAAANEAEAAANGFVEGVEAAQANGPI